MGMDNGCGHASATRGGVWGWTTGAATNPATCAARLGLPYFDFTTRREGPVTSNVSQSYPYTSESEAERASQIASLVAAKDDLAAKLAAETTPLDANERWWVWKCPTKGCAGLLHVAGYAAEKHAIYVVCDGTCGKTFLR
jgi:hypothetical protein